MQVGTDSKISVTFVKNRFFFIQKIRDVRNRFNLKDRWTNDAFKAVKFYIYSAISNHVHFLMQYAIPR